MAFGIFDFVVLGVLLLFGIIGLIRGARKVLFGLVASLAAFIGALVLAGVVGNLLIGSFSLYGTLSSKIAEAMAPSFVYGGQNLVYIPDGDKMVLGFYDGTVQHAFADAFEGSALSSFATILQSPIESIYTQDIAMNTPMPLPAILGQFFASLVFKAVCFIVLFIVFIIIVKLIDKLLKKVIGSSKLGHFFDRILGLVVGIGFGAIFVFIIFTLLQVLSGFGFMAPVNEAIDSSFLAPYIKQYNFIYTLFDQYWGIGSLADKLSGVVSSGSVSGTGSGSGV